MRILFMGTPKFAACSLERLYRDGHDICAVFTQPDKPKNRGMKLTESPVKLFARSKNLPVYQPGSLKNPDTEAAIRELSPELIVVVAYGKILPKAILGIPPAGCVNVHASLLPKYRGAAPIQWAVLNGERETGVTVMHMAEELDAGDIISVKRTDILPLETAGGLFDRLMALGAELLGDTIPKIARGDAERFRQNPDEVTYAPPLTKAMSPIDWEKTGAEIVNQVRGLNPWPVAEAEIGGRKFKVFAAESTESLPGKAPGEIVSAGKAGLEIACADGTVIITELQAPGKKRMRASAYLMGNPI